MDIKNEVRKIFGIPTTEEKLSESIKSTREEFDITYRDGRVYITHGQDAILDVTDKPMEDIKQLISEMQHTLIKWRELL
jgi:hypothetical protein